MHIALDRTKVSDKRCEECAETFQQITGLIVGEGQPLGFYIIGLHGHSPEGRLAHLAVSLCSLEAVSESVAIIITANSKDFHFRFVDWSDSPWRTEELEDRIDRDAALQSDLRPTFLHVAEHVVRDNPEVTNYFSDEPKG